MVAPNQEILTKGSQLNNNPKFHAQGTGSDKTLVTIENQLHSDSLVFDVMNKYKGTLQYTVSILSGPAGNEPGGNSKGGAAKTDAVDIVDKIIYNQVASPSLFNPYYSVLAGGVTPNVPLLDTAKNGDGFEAEHSNGDGLKTTGRVQLYPTDDCSIKTLVELSKLEHGPLGQARYKYSDFMYCKDLGKISNNHMITLRKFATPVSDNIFYATTLDDAGNFSTTGDVGRLITWFGTDDNKLEDILKYSYKAEFKEFEAKIDAKDSQEDDPERGIIGQFANLFNPAYNQNTERGVSPSSLAFILGTGSSDAVYDSKPYANNVAVNGTPYWDKNRIYEPKDTLRSTYQYTGELKFEHAFTLTFKYKLRGYDNINAKSAFLDLLGNILAVTYRQGTFWGGEQRIIGSPQNKRGWKKAQEFVNNGIDAGGTFIQSLLNGNNFSDAANTFATAITSGLNSSFGIDFSAVLGDPMGVINDMVGSLKKADLASGLKGIIKNQLGRPAIYAFDSILTNDAVGLWHVTIGNPLNPIAVMGNLILDNAEITHSGPLGLDDFPTELTVTIALKHGMPRDSVDIQRMYTQGRNAIYSKIGNTKNYKFNESTKDSTMAGSINDTTVYSKGNVKQLSGAFININETKTATGLDHVGWIGENNYTRFIEGNLRQLK